MKISIIIISYNEGKYLSEAIESCLKQDIFNKKIETEIIIGDDGSNDGSLEIIQHYAKSYPKIISYYIMERNITGPVISSFRASNVIKHGLEVAKGDYVQILSGDDVLSDEKKISSSLEFLENHSDYASCYTDYKHFWDDGRERFPKNKKANFSRPVLWSFEYRHISCYLFRREVEKYLLNRFCDDTGLFYSCFIAGKAKHLQTVSFGYRQRATGIMSTSNSLELDLLELLLFQDVLNKGAYRKSSLAKFCMPLLRVWKSKDEIAEEKYKKYLKAARGVTNDYLNILNNWNDNSINLKISFYKMMLSMIFYRIIFKGLDIIETLIK